MSALVSRVSRDGSRRNFQRAGHRLSFLFVSTYVSIRRQIKSKNLGAWSTDGAVYWRTLSCPHLMRAAVTGVTELRHSH